MLESYWEEIDSTHYDYVWNTLHNREDFIILNLRENFDLSDTIPREELDYIIEEAGIDVYALAEPF